MKDIAMKRFPDIPIENRTAEQQKVVDTIASGPRGGLRGPFPTLLHAPELASRLAHLGEYLRFNILLEKSLAELAVLVTARQWTAQFEFYAHAKHARNAGLDPAIIDAIANGHRPASMSQAETVVYDFCTELHRSHGVGDATFQRAVELFGHKGTAELIGLTGYYTMVAMVLNVAEVSVPVGEKPPLGPI
jgi:4-carboxymuconolactone decarboxylase